MRILSIIIFGVLCPAAAFSGAKYSTESAAAEAIAEVKEFITDRTYDEYVHQVVSLQRSRDSLIKLINSEDTSLTALWYREIGGLEPAEPPRTKKRYSRRNLDFQGLLSSPTFSAQLFSVVVHPGAWRTYSPPTAIVARSADSIWYVVEPGPSCWDFPIDSGVNVISTLLNTYPSERLDSLMAINVATLAYSFPNLVRLNNDPEIYGHGNTDFLDYYFPDFSLEGLPNNDSLLPLEEVAPPVATQTGSGYSVVLYYWVNEPAVYRVTLQVTKSSLTLENKTRLGSFGPSMIRID